MARSAGWRCAGRPDAATSPTHANGTTCGNGWNLTGDTYMRDADGYFWYQARSDDMIISGGYNIAGPEVENALLLHAAVAECAVIGVPDVDRGSIVKAVVVLKPGNNGDAAMTQSLQDFVKAAIAPYKYPRAIEYRAELPKTQTGKLQRFRLRDAEKLFRRLEQSGVMRLWFRLQFQIGQFRLGLLGQAEHLWSRPGSYCGGHGSSMTPRIMPRPRAR